jgi:hypothetical protein
MKTIRDVYQKLREVKYHHLVKLYKRYLKKSPENCKYNYKYEFISDGQVREIRLCLLHQPNLDLKSGVFPHLVDVCELPKHSVNCDAFIPKYSKDDIKNKFEEILKENALREKLYPDICALEWVLEKSVINIPLLGSIQRLYYMIKHKLSKNKIL